MLVHAGETLTIDAWATKTGLPVETIRCRIDRLLWTVERALTTPSDRRFRRGGRPRSDVPRPVPNLRHDKVKNRAFSRWQAYGRDNVRYFGEWGSAATIANYRRFAAEWAAGSFEAAPLSESDDVYVADVIMRWLDRCKQEYRKHGKLTSEWHSNRSAMCILNDIYGDLSAADFTPAALRAVRKAMIERKWTRKTVNDGVKRVVRMFAFAVGQSLVSPNVLHALREVESLRAGRGGAPDRPRVKPATAEQIEAVMPHLSPIPARRAKLEAMIRVHRLTGMRPGELCALRPADIDRTADIWLYTVRDEANKNLHRGKAQRYFIGPKAQALLLPHLAAKPDEPVFGTTRVAYGKAVHYACKAAGIEPWHPHQLRHALATEVASRFKSLDAAAAAIGDAKQTAEAVYIHVDPAERARIEVARLMG
jgi:integrase